MQPVFKQRKQLCKVSYMFKYIWSFLKKIFGFPKELLAKRKKAIDRKERMHIAKVFNDRYAYRIVYDESKPKLTGSYYGVQHSGGYAWMCPTCNKNTPSNRRISLCWTVVP